jgi:Adaptor complexes medium subunit family
MVLEGKILWCWGWKESIFYGAGGKHSIALGMEGVDICMVLLTPSCAWGCLCSQIRATLEDGYSASLKRGIGPINLQFTIPMYCASRLHVKYLQIAKADKSYSPYRWVRYVTMSNSYVVRI